MKSFSPDSKNSFLWSFFVVQTSWSTWNISTGSSRHTFSMLTAKRSFSLRHIAAWHSNHGHVRQFIDQILKTDTKFIQCKNMDITWELREVRKTFIGSLLLLNPRTRAKRLEKWQEFIESLNRKRGIDEEWSVQDQITCQFILLKMNDQSIDLMCFA